MKIAEARELTDGVAHLYQWLLHCTYCWMESLSLTKGYGATLDKMSCAEEIYLLKQAIANKNHLILDLDSLKLENRLLLSHSRTTVELVNDINILRDALKVAPCHCSAAMEIECVRCSALKETE